MKPYIESHIEKNGTHYSLVYSAADGQKYLAVAGDMSGFEIDRTDEGQALCALSPENANVLRTRLPWLKPVPLGRQISFGFGDRLGSATPGHIQSIKGTNIAPIFAQQSVRENTRIGRTPQQVMDDAMWGVFQTGWQAPWGADADHVKEVADVASFVAAGYTFFTIDPSDHVDNAAQTDTLDALRQKAAQLPWDSLETSYQAWQQNYCQSPIMLNGLTLEFTEEILLRAAVKYGHALNHTLIINQVLQTQIGAMPFDLEMSVDETDTPTSIHEHFFIAQELTARQIPVVSLAPRFVGKFQKGVDYIGDLAQFEAELVKHTAIMRHFDSYKMSIHTGSDKFSIYPIIAKHCAGWVHVKTAGTSYLEILRVLAAQVPGLFRTILDFSRTRFEYDRKTYYLDAQLEKVPTATALSDAELPGLLEQFDARQVLHVTFGSVLDKYGADIHAFAASHEADYQAALKKHFQRHLAPFVTT